MGRSRQLHLGAFMRPVSIHTGAWRYPGAYPDANFNFDALKTFARRLEAAKFDAFFMADHLAVLNMPINALKRSHTVTSFEPFTLLSALAALTERIGLIATASTTFDEPITSPAVSRRWTISAAAAPAGTSSPPPTRTPRSTSATRRTSITRHATSARASSTTW